MRLPSKSSESRVSGWALGLGARDCHRLLGMVETKARARGLDLQLEGGEPRTPGHRQGALHFDEALGGPAALLAAAPG